jgi:hypothetical protein
MARRYLVDHSIPEQRIEVVNYSSSMHDAQMTAQKNRRVTLRILE